MPSPESARTPVAAHSERASPQRFARGALYDLLQKRLYIGEIRHRMPESTRALICLSIEAKLKRSGGEVHLVVSPNSGGVPSHQPNQSLMKAVARARSWYERVLEGKSSNQRSLTLHAGLTRRYIGRVFDCAFLAPDIVEAILEGRQPRDLSFKKLCAHIPLSWVEQRKQFGFSPR